MNNETRKIMTYTARSSHRAQTKSHSSKPIVPSLIPLCPLGKELFDTWNKVRIRDCNRAHNTRNLLFFVVSIVPLIFSVPAMGQTVASKSADANPAVSSHVGNCSTTLIFENDRFFTDRNYTTGLLIGRVCISEENEITAGPWTHFLRRQNKALLENIMPLLDISGRKYRGNFLYGGLYMYTPNSLDHEQPRRDDGRPYASLIVFGDSIVYVDDEYNQAIKQEIQFGVLGHPVVGYLQGAVHRSIGGDVPMGWSSEVSRGGEPTFSLCSPGKTISVY